MNFDEVTLASSDTSGALLHPHMLLFVEVDFTLPKTLISASS